MKVVALGQVDEVIVPVTIEVAGEEESALNTIPGPRLEEADVKRAVATGEPGMNVIRLGEMNEVILAVAAEVTALPVSALDTVTGPGLEVAYVDAAARRRQRCCWGRRRCRCRRGRRGLGWCCCGRWCRCRRWYVHRRRRWRRRWGACRRRCRLGSRRSWCRCWRLSLRRGCGQRGRWRLSRRRGCGRRGGGCRRRRWRVCRGW